MLILTRSRDEKILIGDNIEIMVVDIRGDKVRLGVTAPRGVSVDREEIRQLRDVGAVEDATRPPR